MSARPVRYADDFERHIGDPVRPMTPQRIAIDGRSFWISSANGCAVAAEVAADADDYRTGALSIVVYQDARPDLPDGIALSYVMTPDEAVAFARNLVKGARAMRANAVKEARAALRRAAGK